MNAVTISLKNLSDEEKKELTEKIIEQEFFRVTFLGLEIQGEVLLNPPIRIQGNEWGLWDVEFSYRRV